MITATSAGGYFLARRGVRLAEGPVVDGGVIGRQTRVVRDGENVLVTRRFGWLLRPLLD
jgi:hypothetical protein